MKVTTILVAATTALGVCATIAFGVSAAYAMPQGMSKACQGEYKKYKKKKGPKAFAVSSDKHCGWWWGADSLSKAKENAIKGCKEYSSNEDSCRVVESSSK